MKVDLDAAVIPGKEAAGVPLGMAIRALLDDNPDYFEHKIVTDALHRPTCHRYRFPCVDIWGDNNGTVIQIMVHGHYRGQVQHLIGLGSTTDDIECLIGPTDEDSENNLVIIEVAGFSFEIDGLIANPDWKKNAIIQMFVFFDTSGNP